MRALRILAAFTALALATAHVLPADASHAATDREEITATALDYAEGWYTGDADRMRRALHPELAKRIVRSEGGNSVLEAMTADELATAAGGGFGTRTPEGERQADVEILDVFGTVATLKVTMRDWVDYMHMGKVDGRWVIINVLWDMKPRS
jgi:hypothetical protein